MKNITFVSFFIFSLVLLACDKNEEDNYNIIFLHHSTGNNIWDGQQEMMAKLSKKLEQSTIKKTIKTHDEKYVIEEMFFPKAEPYGWNNYPFDYYNIWVKNAGYEPYMEEPTLEMLTEEYDMIIWKHCFPVSNIKADTTSGNIDSELKTIPNYKLQYAALKEKMNEFKDTKFLVWTGAAQVESQITEEEAIRAKDFFSWVVNEWDLPDDNIYLWDFRKLETEGGLYLKPAHAQNINDSHPNAEFSEKAAQLFAARIIDVIETDGRDTSIDGTSK